MKILLVYNATAPRCAFRNHGEQWTTALRRAGQDVTVWDGTPAAVAERIRAATCYPVDTFWPADVEDYDVVHLMWHPGPMGHYSGAPRLQKPLTSILVGEVPPWATCPIQDRYQVKFSREFAPGCILLSDPVIDWVTLPLSNPACFTVGVTGIRGESWNEIEALCRQHGWYYNEPSKTWLSPEDEVRRLATSTVNVCWYKSVIGGLAGAPATALSSHRPLLINDNDMFRHVQGAPGVYCWPTWDLEKCLVEIDARRRYGYLRQREFDADQQNWSEQVHKLLRVWEDAITCR